MKNFKLSRLSILFFAGIVTFSCQEEVYLEQTFDDNVPIQTRALSIDEPSASNPNLHNDWQNVTKLFLNGGGEVDAPWVYREGVSNNIPLNYRTDIKREDGWTMMSHTLISTASVEPNYILLYNKRTGILKVFYYNRNPFNNNSFLWVLEADSPTSVFPSNTLLQGTMNSKTKYVTTSNIVEQSSFNFAQLNAGWNAFSFELPYGTIDNNPVVSIKGYNSLQSEITGSGKYSGEVIIPVAGGATGFASLMSALQGVAGVVSTFIPQVATVEKAIALTGTVLGNTALYKSSATNVRATSSGNFTLDASSFTTLGGAVYSLNNITLKRLNRNDDLGLWTLRTKPSYTCNKYNSARFNQSRHTFSGDIKMTAKEPIYDLVSINPSIINSIASYRVISTDFFVTSTDCQYDLSQVTDKIYHINKNSRGLSVSGWSDYVPAPGTNCFVEQTDGFYVNVTVEFIYHDGSSFISSRNFDVNIERVNNSSILRHPYCILFDCW